MSEQPALNNIYDLSQRRNKADGSLEMGPETDVLLRASNLPQSKSKVSAADVMYPKAKVTEISPEIAELRLAAQEVSNLAAVRQLEVA